MDADTRSERLDGALYGKVVPARRVEFKGNEQIIHSSALDQNDARRSMALGSKCCEFMERGATLSIRSSTEGHGSLAGSTHSPIDGAPVYPSETMLFRRCWRPLCYAFVTVDERAHRLACPFRSVGGETLHHRQRRAVPSSVSYGVLLADTSARR